RDRNVTGVQTCALPIFHIEQESVLIITQDSFFYSTQNLYSRNSVRTREKGKRFYAALPLLLVLPSPMACWNSLSFIRASGLMTRSEERRVGQEGSTGLP